MAHVSSASATSFSCIHALPLRRQLAALLPYTGTDSDALSLQAHLIRTYVPPLPWNNPLLIPLYLKNFQSATCMPMLGGKIIRWGGLRPLHAAMLAWETALHKGETTPTHMQTHIQALLGCIEAYHAKRPSPPLKMLWVFLLGGRLSRALLEITEHLHPPAPELHADALLASTPPLPPKDTALYLRSKTLEAPYFTPDQRCAWMLTLFRHPSGTLLHALLVQDFILGSGIFTLHSETLSATKELLDDPIVTSTPIFANLYAQAEKAQPSNPLEHLQDPIVLTTLAFWKHLFVFTAQHDAPCMGYLVMCNDLIGLAQQQGIDTLEDRAFLSQALLFTPKLYHALQHCHSPSEARLLLKEEGFEAEPGDEIQKFMFQFFLKNF
jgi:hypothetical protein